MSNSNEKVHKMNWSNWQRSMSISVLFAMAFFINACKKEEEKTIHPVITFKSISTTEVVQFSNSVVIKFDYEDWQGDLGEPDPDEYSLSVKDSRLTDADWYHIPPMTPDLQELHIEGTYSVELPPLFLLGNGSQETTTFTLQIKDRAGNISNQISTPVVLITDSL